MFLSFLSVFIVTIVLFRKFCFERIRLKSVFYIKNTFLSFLSVFVVVVVVLSYRNLNRKCVVILKQK